ncbi:hypothetical protein [Zooshikella ganghwensis]|uniref:Uncharacterized protein n=1 Tax=Zooshikella ganghwensis TaxID=202772 RepID=A0A4P9VGG5_9GAMM|nr:hypothetical protein [Zooshikella ganghwensis]RDH41439.1 hypothetical protein B9G39_28700 [Zooshikella ganghwensis]
MQVKKFAFKHVHRECTLFLISGQVQASGFDNVINELLNPSGGEVDIWFYGWFVVWLMGLLVCFPFFVSAFRRYRKKESWFVKAVLGVVILVVVESVASVVYLGALFMFALLH